MILIILGAILGGLFAYWINKCCNIPYGKSGGYINLPDKGDFLVMFGVILGAGMGLGYGSSLLISGSHPYNHIINTIKN